jgi:hypothetical protein
MNATKCLNIESPLRPIACMIVEKTQGQRTKLPLQALMDPGSNHSYVQERASPKGAVPKMTKSSPVKTLNGTTKHNHVVELDGLILPEFSQSRRIDNTSVCFVSNQDTNANVILENDFLQAIRINCNGNNAITWFDTNAP